MNDKTSFILAMSCALPALLGLTKYRNSAYNYRPFLLLMIIAMITELIAGIPVLVSKNYVPLRLVYAFYPTIEIFLILLFFKRNKIVAYKNFAWFVTLTVALIYIISFLYTHTTNNTATNYCDISTTVIILILSVKMLSNEIFETKIMAFKNPKMIISFGYIFFNSFELLGQVFLHFNSQRNIYLNIFMVYQIPNMLSYLIFTWAIIWIPTKMKY
jgi:hypothetical protein